MSHQEQHPLDERFRQVLQHAEAAPPPAVWEAVKQAQEGGKRRAAWWRWSLPALAILLLTGVTATYFALRSPGTAEERARQAATSQEAVHAHLLLADTDTQAAPTATGFSMAAEFSSTKDERAAVLIAPDVVHATKPAKAMSTPPALSEIGGAVPGEVQVQGAGEVGSAAAVRGSTTKNEDLVSTVLSTTADPFVDDLETTKGAAETPVPITDMGVDRLLIRAPRFPFAVHGTLPNSVPKPAPYLLPHGEWWLAPVVGVYSVRDRWRGEDRSLVQALEQATGTTTAWAFGLAAGRQWRSGFGLSTGLLTERTESQLYHRDTRVQVEQEITTYLVTLNTQVFISDADTVTIVTADDRSSSGLQRRTAWRVPLDLHKRWSIGRLQVGLHGGLALEWTTVQGASLVAADAEGGLVAADPGAAEFRARNPTALLGNVGAELGWMLNERWTLWVDPVYMSGVSALARTSVAYTLPQRWGIQFGLAHHFIPSRSK